MGSRLGGCGGLYYGSVRCDPGWALGWEGVAGCTMAVYAVTRGGLRQAGRVWRAVLWQCML